MGSQGGSRNQALSVTSKTNERLRLQPSNQTSDGQARVFNHLCTVDDAHRNTVTGLQVVPKSGVFESLSPSFPFVPTKKMFSCSLDSTVKCWTFDETQDNSNKVSIDSSSAPQGQVYDFTEARQKYSPQFSEIQQHGRASKRVKVNSMVYING